MQNGIGRCRVIYDPDGAALLQAIDETFARCLRGRPAACRGYEDRMDGVQAWGGLRLRAVLKEREAEEKSEEQELSAARAIARNSSAAENQSHGRE
jgi:hypothetical protein